MKNTDTEKVCIDKAHGNRMKFNLLDNMNVGPDIGSRRDIFIIRSMSGKKEKSASPKRWYEGRIRIKYSGWSGIAKIVFSSTKRVLGSGGFTFEVLIRK